MKINDIMSTDLVICSSNDSIYDVSNLMLKYDIGFIPVHENKRIIGVITDRDILIKAISSNCNCDDSIYDFITRNVIKIDKLKDIEDALDLMAKNKVKRLIVSDKDKIVGVVSLSDIINNITDSEKLINTLKSIYEINRNIDDFDTEIDEFYL